MEHDVCYIWGDLGMNGQGRKEGEKKGAIYKEEEGGKGSEGMGRFLLLILLWLY